MSGFQMVIQYLDHHLNTFQVFKWWSDYCNDTESLYHSFMHSLDSHKIGINLPVNRQKMLNTKIELKWLYIRHLHK